MELLRAPPASPIPISKASLLRGKISLKKSLLASSSAYWMPTLASVTMPVSSLFVSKATNLQAGTSIISVESAKKDVLTALSQIIDPDFGTDIVSCGFVKDLHIDDVLKEVSFRLELTTPACPIKDVFEQKANEVVATIPWVEKVNVKMSAQPAKPVFAGELPKGLQTISNIIAVSSCKGQEDTAPIDLTEDLDVDLFEGNRRKTDRPTTQHGVTKKGKGKRKMTEIEEGEEEDWEDVETIEDEAADRAIHYNDDSLEDPTSDDSDAA